jgi:hypothetical protein
MMLHKMHKIFVTDDTFLSQSYLRKMGEQDI